MKSFGQRVRELRRAKGWTLRDLAEQTGYSQPFLSDLERDETGYKLQTAEKIAGAFSISLELLRNPDFDLEHIAEISEILELLPHIPPDKLPAVKQMLEALRD